MSAEFRVLPRGRSTTWLSKPNSSVYALYTQGRFYLNKRSVESVQKSIDFFQQAIQAEPNLRRLTPAWQTRMHSPVLTATVFWLLVSPCPRPKRPLRRRSRSMILPQMRTPRWPT